MKTQDPSYPSGLQSRELLKQVLLEKLKKNPSYSLRAAARDLGVTHGYLSLIVAGKKRLSFQRAIQFSQFLKMDEMRTAGFLRAVALESIKNPTCRSFLENSLTGEDGTQAGEFATLELDRFRILSEWYHIAILDLTLLKQFKPDANWVAAELGITVEQVTHAVSRLERLGLLDVSEGKWTKAKVKLAVPATYSDRAVRDFHGQMIDKARNALQSAEPQDFAAREISSATFAIDPIHMEQAKYKIEKFKREMIEFMGNGECTALYQMNVQLFPLNKTRVAKVSKKQGVKK